MRPGSFSQLDAGELLQQTSPKADCNGQERWRAVVERLDFAFQPIVNIHTGVCLGYEALVRNWHEAGFVSIEQMFDTAWEQASLQLFESLLRERAIRKYIRLPHHQKTTLFLNLDNRLLQTSEPVCGNFAEILEAHGIQNHMICMEISEKHPITDYQEFCRYCRKRKSAHVKVAIDDFGSGFSGLQLLYFAEPNYIKIDRFFINDIAQDAKKKLFVAKVLNLAHILGSMVIAEGVETEKEYYVCKDIGCDYVQGYFVQRPTINLAELELKYQAISKLGGRERRGNYEDEKLITANIDFVPPVILGSEQDNCEGLEMILKKFWQHKERTFFPILNRSHEPLGVIREKHLKDYVYTQYGRNLLLNKNLGNNVQKFLTHCPVMEQSRSIEKLLEVFSLSKDTEGIILTRNGQYIGFLSTTAIINILNEKNLAIARDQNPLSKMPGNSMIEEYLSRAYDDIGSGYALVYFDFNDFKPFNDYYGFRRGDRAILLFADLLRNAVYSSGEHNFAGHLGGDDFFAGLSLGAGSYRSVCEFVTKTMQSFQHNAESLYDQIDRKRGYIIASDRSGKRKKFGLLTTSSAVLLMQPGLRRYSMDDIIRTIATLKKEAKSDELRRSSLVTLKREVLDAGMMCVEKACETCGARHACNLPLA